MEAAIREWCGASFSGSKAAKVFENRLFGSEAGLRRSIIGLRNIQGILHECKRGLKETLEVRKLGAMEVLSFRPDAFRWLVEESRGVWIVRLITPGVADHRVVVETSVALIFDSSSRNAISLNEEALWLCGGDTARELRVAEVRRLLPQKVTRKPNSEREAKRPRLDGFSFSLFPE